MVLWLSTWGNNLNMRILLFLSVFICWFAWGVPQIPGCLVCSVAWIPVLCFKHNCTVLKIVWTFIWILCRNCLCQTVCVWLVFIVSQVKKNTSHRKVAGWSRCFVQWFRCCGCLTLNPRSPNFNLMLWPWEQQVMTQSVESLLAWRSSGLDFNIPPLTSAPQAALCIWR